MPTTVEISTTLACTPDEAFARVQTTALMCHIAAPLLRFVPQRQTLFPAVWAPGEYRVWLWLFSVLPLGWQAIVISAPPAKGDTRFLRDDGYGPLIRRWNHLIMIAPNGEGTTHYTDRVIIEAGLLTPLVAGFARAFFAHRQRRWRALARTGFAGLAD